jgi:hypothetical protein
MIHTLHAKLKDDPRLVRVLQGGVSGIAGKVTAVLANAVSLPIAVRYLGREQYGFWVTISTTIMMLAGGGSPITGAGFFTTVIAPYVKEVHVLDVNVGEGRSRLPNIIFHRNLGSYESLAQLLKKIHR